MLQHALGRQKVAGCGLVWSLCDTRLRGADRSADGCWTKKPHRPRLRQPAQVRRRHFHDDDDISGQKLPRELPLTRS